MTDDELRAEIAELKAENARVSAEFVRTYPALGLHPDTAIDFDLLARIAPDLHRLYGVEFDTTGMATDEALRGLIEGGAQ